MQPSGAGFHRLIDLASGAGEGSNTIWFGEEADNGNFFVEMGHYTNKYMATWSGLFDAISDGSFHDILVVFNGPQNIITYIDGVAQTTPTYTTNG